MRRIINRILTRTPKNRIGGPATAPAPPASNYVLREDGSYLLREDGSKIVRES